VPQVSQAATICSSARSLVEVPAWRVLLSQGIVACLGYLFKSSGSIGEKRGGVRTCAGSRPEGETTAGGLRTTPILHSGVMHGSRSDPRVSPVRWPHLDQHECPSQKEKRASLEGA
jgi:hypothetical protein